MYRLRYGSSALLASVLVISIVACGLSPNSATPTSFILNVTPTGAPATITLTSTTEPTATLPPTATYTPLPTITPQPTATPALPAPISTKFAENRQVIGSSNLNSLELVSSWGHGPLYDLRLLPDGQTAIADFSDTSTLVSLNGNQSPIDLPLRYDTAFSADGSLAANYTSGALRVYSLPDGKLLFLTPLDGCIQQLFITPDKQRIIVSGCDAWYTTNNKSYIIKADDGRKILEVVDKGQVALSPDGKFIAAASTKYQDRTVTVWNTSDGSKVDEFLAVGQLSYLSTYGRDPDQIWLPDEKPGVHNMSKVMLFTPDSKNLVIFTVSADQIWNVVTNKEVRLLSAGRPSFSEDGSLMLTETYEGTYNVYNTTDWSLITYQTVYAAEIFGEVRPN